MIYLTSDIHGHIRLPYLKGLLQNIPLQKDDYLIILGDAGIVWIKTEHKEVRDFYNSLPNITLFLDGNHENFDLLEQYEEQNFFGGKAQKISDKIYRLMRGCIFSFDNTKIFVFGGGFSVKKLDGTSPISVWDQEMPNEQEYERGITNLKQCGNRVDYVLTHVAPTSVAERIGANLVPQERILNDYLETIKDTVEYRKWYFGHYHVDKDVGKFSTVYNRLLTLGENQK